MDEEKTGPRKWSKEVRRTIAKVRKNRRDLHEAMQKRWPEMGAKKVKGYTTEVVNSAVSEFAVGGALSTRRVKRSSRYPVEALSEILGSGRPHLVEMGRKENGRSKPLPITDYDFAEDWSYTDAVATLLQHNLRL